jgi:hypothetical protein
MSFLERILSKFSWRAKLRMTQRENQKIGIEQGQLFRDIILALPDSFKEYKEQAKVINYGHFSEQAWQGFKTSFASYPLEYRKAGVRFAISGIELFYIPGNTYMPVQILVMDNLLAGINVQHAEFRRHEFDVTRINTANITTTALELPETDQDRFIKTLDEDIKQKINVADMFEIEDGNKIFYTIYDLEDGNYLAVDKNQNVYSLVHDARPVSKKMNISLKDILDQIANGAFDAEQHFDERYRTSKGHAAEE